MQIKYSTFTYGYMNHKITPPMDIDLPSHDTSLEYIDMEPGSYLRHGSSQHQREFEFQMSTDSLQGGATTSPADELFYKGKLLPLHLPPRIEMVEKLLWDSVSAYEGLYGTHLAATAPVSTTVSTPFESCNVSPCESCSISRELSPEVYSREYLTMDDFPKKSWSRNIMLIKHLFVPKLKGSRAFFKFFIRKSGCSDDSSTVTGKGFVAPSSRRRDTSLNSKGNSHKGDGFRQVQPNQSPVKSSSLQESAMEDGFDFRLHRRSLSLSSRWRHSNKICSSSFSSSSSSSSSSSALAPNEQSASWRRSRCLYVDTESPIQAAIAYCKQSQNPPVVLEKQSNS